MAYLLFIANIFTLRLLLAQAFNLYLGYTGILALCHVAFAAIGSYTGAILLLNGTPFWLATLAAVSLSMLLGLLIGLSSMRLRADYLAIATLGFAEIILTVSKTWTSVTNGVHGLAGIPRPSIFGVTLNTDLKFLIFSGVIVSALMFLMYKIVKSPFGKTLETIRDDELAAKSLGLPATRQKLIIFCVAAGIAAVEGVLFASYIRFISPVEFSLDVLSLILVVVIVGGLGTFRGPFWGTLLVTGLIEALRFLPIPPEAIGPLRLMLYSGIFLAIMRFKPEGLAGLKKTTKRITY